MPTQRLLNRNVAEHLSKQNWRLDRSEIGRPQTAEEAHCDIVITTPANLMNRVDVDVVNEETEPKRERRARTVRAIEQSVRAIEQSMTNLGHPTP